LFLKRWRQVYTALHERVSFVVTLVKENLNSHIIVLCEEPALLKDVVTKFFEQRRAR
jgi:hypothetical protein